MRAETVLHELLTRSELGEVGDEILQQGNYGGEHRNLFKR
jgi:hypothetical protein